MLLHSILDQGASIREIETNLYSCLSEGDEGAPYDRYAAAYDRAVSNAIYLKIAWGVSRSNNAEFVRKAFRLDDEGAPPGWVVDIAAGSCVDSAQCYLESERPTIVLDRSLGMLQRGMERVRSLKGEIPPNIHFLQADANALPLRPRSIRTILCHGAFHVFPETAGLVAEWRRVLEENGSVHVSSLIRGRWFGDRYLAMLHRTGEISAPRSEHEFVHALEQQLGAAVEVETVGNFAYAHSSTC